MKILIIRTFPTVLDPTGYNIQEIGMAKALVAAGQVCDVVLYNGSEDDRIKGIEVQRLDGSKGYVHVYMKHGFAVLKNGFFPGLRRLTRRYDLLQVHEYDQITSWKYYAWQRKRPVIIYHGPYFCEFNKGYNLKCRIFDKTFLKLRSGKKTLCLTKSEAAAKFLRSKGFKQVEALGVGLDTDNFKQPGGPDRENDPVISDTLQAKTDDDAFNLLYVGVLEQRRNSLMLAEVMKNVCNRIPKAHFTIVGKGEADYQEQFLHEADELIKTGKVTYVERMSQAQLRGLYTHMDAFVFPSNYDIFGMVLLEAMYFDLPVISSDNGGSDMLIKDGVNGIIVSDFEVDSWTEAICSLAENKERYEALKNTLRAEDHKKYTWQGIADSYLKIIREAGLYLE